MKFETITSPRRNDPCACGSGKRYKHCHGALSEASDFDAADSIAINLIERLKAKEAQRRQQQGLGRPIVSEVFKGYRFVAVGSKVFWGKWLTFFDFLGYYIRVVLGADWGQAEIAKPLKDRHPIIQWYDAVCRLQANAAARQGQVYESPMNGAAAAYFGLAYNLFLLAHNIDLQRRLVDRLKHPDQFYGAYFEAFVAGCFLLTGFDLALEDETDGKSTHVEFTATSKFSGKSFSVEAKSRTPNKSHLNVRNQLYSALRKSADHPRIVLIDMNLPEQDVMDASTWTSQVAPSIKAAEAGLRIDGQAAPPAFVIVTNHPYHYDLDRVGTGFVVMAAGFKIPDFGIDAQFTSYTAAFKSRQKYSDLYRLLKAFQGLEIPATFDGETSEFAFGAATRRWTIGDCYDLSARGIGTSARLEAATVVPSEKKALLDFRLSDGRTISIRETLDDAELAAYQKHPDTFFGVEMKVAKDARDPHDLYDFFHGSYKSASREALLNLFSPADEAVRNLSTEDLLYELCERYVLASLRMSAKPTP